MTEVAIWGFFIGPRSDHSLPMSVTDSLTKGRHQWKKKRFLSGIALMRGGGLPMPEFFGPFQEVHFRSIKRVYIFKNANVLNF